MTNQNSKLETFIAEAVQLTDSAINELKFRNANSLRNLYDMLKRSWTEFLSVKEQKVKNPNFELMYNSFRDDLTTLDSFMTNESIEEMVSIMNVSEKTMSINTVHWKRYEFTTQPEYQKYVDQSNYNGYLSAITQLIKRMGTILEKEEEDIKNYYEMPESKDDLSVRKVEYDIVKLQRNKHGDPQWVDEHIVEIQILSPVNAYLIEYFLQGYSEQIAEMVVNGENVKLRMMFDPIYSNLLSKNQQVNKTWAARHGNYMKKIQSLLERNVQQNNGSEMNPLLVIQEKERVANNTEILFPYSMEGFAWMMYKEMEVLSFIDSINVKNVKQLMMMKNVVQNIDTSFIKSLRSRLSVIRENSKSEEASELNRIFQKLNQHLVFLMRKVNSIRAIYEKMGDMTGPGNQQ